jgi:hypothetical protein
VSHFFAVRFARCRATILCRASNRCRATLHCRASNRTFAVRRREARTAKTVPARTIPVPARTGGRHVASLPCVCTRQSDQMVLCRVHTHGKEAPVFQIFSVFF